MERLEVALLPSAAVPSRRMSEEELRRLRELKVRMGFGRLGTRR